MLTKFNNNIQSKVFTGLALLISVVMVLIFCILESSRQSQKLINEKSQVNSLNDSLTNIKRSNAIYLSNAARDYESYFRDLDVYYKVLVQDLENIDEKIARLSKTNLVLTELSQSSINFINTSSIIQLNLAIENTQSSWDKFKSELSSQFGKNKNEPRLEWGAKYIGEKIPKLSHLFSTLIKNFDAISLQQNQLSKTTVKITILTLLIFTSGFAFFFYFQIINPIKTTKNAFQRVSEGDFGHQIITRRNDEIGQLIRSFNQMSARSDSVLSILSKLQAVKSYNEIVDILHSQLTSYIGCDSVILVKKNLFNQSYTLTSVSPKSNFKNLYKINIPIENPAQSEHLSKIFSDEIAIQINNLENYISQYRNNVILKTIISRYPLKSALFQPLTSGSQNMALIFVSYHEGQLTEKHLELIKHLSPFINHKIKALESITTTEEVHQKKWGINDTLSLV